MVCYVSEVATMTSAPQTSAPSSANQQMTIPQRPTPSSLATVAAAADATAMPPPPALGPAAHASIRRVNAASITAGAVTRAVAPAASSCIAVAKTGLGTPTPLAIVPAIASTSTTAATGYSDAAARASAAVSSVGVRQPTQQRELTAGNHTMLSTTKVASPIAVPAGSNRAAAMAQQSHLGRVPQPVHSSAAAQPQLSTTAKFPTPTSSGRQQQQQQQLRVQTTKYIANTPNVALQIPTIKRVVATTATSGAAATTATKPNVPKQPGLVQQSIPTAVASTLYHRPVAAAPSGVATHVSHMSMGVAPSMAPPPPPPAEISNGGGSSGSGGSGSGGSSKKKSGHPLRRGKWTSEEEAFANRLINEFKSGLLPLTDGTTLRNFLSKLLNCDPMRISKKFVGNNCIGKQVFRRRVAEINRLSADQIRQIRAELSELERRFFDRVAQTNRVKSPGVTAITTGPIMAGAVQTAGNSGGMNIISVGGAGGMVVGREEMDLVDSARPPTPPWLRPPKNYKPKGKFAERSKAKQQQQGAASAPVSSVPTAAIPAVVPAAAPAAGPAYSAGLQKTHKAPVSSTPPLVDVKDVTEKVMEPIMRSGSSLDCLAKAAASGTSSIDDSEAMPRTESALEQLARTASAAKFVEDIVNGDSSKRGAQSQFQGGNKLSQTTLLKSFEALMSLDIQSVENLVEMASTSQSSTLLSEPNDSVSSPEQGGVKSNKPSTSAANMSSRMESFFKSLSSANLLKSGLDSSAALGSLLNATASSNLLNTSGLDSSAALGTLLSAASSNLLKTGSDSGAALSSLLSAAACDSSVLGSLLGATSSSEVFDAEKFSKRVESSTGFSLLRAGEGLENGQHSSVDDFLSLVESGDIPHQDPNMLNVPLQKVMQQNGTVGGPKGGSKRKLSQQQLVALASRLPKGSSMNLSGMTYSSGGSALKKQKKK